MDPKQHDETLRRLENSVIRLETLAEAQEKRETLQEERLSECAHNTERIAKLEERHDQREARTAGAARNWGILMGFISGCLIELFKGIRDWFISQGGYHIK